MSTHPIASCPVDSHRLRRTAPAAALLAACVALGGCADRAPAPGPFDVILRGGTVYDGSGEPPRLADVGIRGDVIAAVGDLSGGSADVTIDARGLAVAPGFINMLSWSTDSLILDGRSQSEIRQGVTLEVFGEGVSYGPVNDTVRRFLTEQRPAEIDFEIAWTTLGGYLEHLEQRGIAPNVASFVGATTVRVHALGLDDRAPTDAELAAMRALVRQAMEEGALGVGSSLIYAPAFYAATGELIELARVAADHGGMYISHIRSEGARLLEGVDELITIARESGAAAEIYHLKAAGRSNWGKLDEVIDRVEAARSEGLRITADMYTYDAAATGLDGAMPPWVQEGTFDAWRSRLQDPAIRRRVIDEMNSVTTDWENLYLDAGPDKMLLVSFRNPDLRHLSGRTLAEVAAERGTSPAETAIDLVIEDGSRVGTVYFLMSEDNVRRQTAIPWVSFGSDEASQAPEGVFLQFMPHPRAYGTFARLLGRYVRDEGVLPLEEAIRKLTSLPAANLGLRRRGALKPGYFADVVVFDPAVIRDHATYEEPHRYATGVIHVFVNGEQVLRDGEHTGATPGRVVRGPGWFGYLPDTGLLPNGRQPSEGLLTGGQPSIEQLAEAAGRGYRTVINLRTPGEGGTGREDVEALGMRYVAIPVRGADGLTDDNVRALADALREAEAPVIVHCASGNRVGALFALKASLLDGRSPDESLRIGKAAGLTRLEPLVRKRLGLNSQP